MKHRQRLRRTAILCCHALRNIAFYKAGWDRGDLIAKDEFWVNINGNFIDTAITEWCKLFGDKRGHHYWRTIIRDKTLFLEKLLLEIDLNEEEFNKYIVELKDYRDKFIAHLDSKDIMNIPKLRTAKDSVSFLYDYLLKNEEQDDCFHDAPENASRYYIKCYSTGRDVYLKNSLIGFIEITSESGGKTL